MRVLNGQQHINNTSTSTMPLQLITTLLPPLSTAPPPPFILFLEPMAETGPNDDNVVGPLVGFSYMFIAFYLIQLTYIFHFL
jgi:hypothetical protein